MNRKPPEIEWGDYFPFQPGVARPWHEISRAEAREVFRKVMEQRHERVEALRRLLGANGIALGTTDRDVEIVEKWLHDHVEADPDNPARPRNLWLAVAFDIGIYLGELMIERRPELRWELYTWGKRNGSYHRPVIMGFDMIDKHYDVDPIMPVWWDATATVQGEDRPPRFLQLLQAAGAAESSERTHEPKGRPTSET